MGRSHARLEPVARIQVPAPQGVPPRPHRSPALNRFPSTLLPASTLLWMALAACGSDSSSGPYRSLDLQAGAPPSFKDPVEFRHYVPGKGSPLWHAEAKESRFTQVPVEPRVGPGREGPLKPAFLVQGPGPKYLSLKDEFDPTQFNRIEVEATVFQQGVEHFSVELRQAGRTLAVSPSLRLAGLDRGPTTLVFDFPEIRNWYAPFDEIRICMPGPAILTTVSMVTLTLEDPTQFLPRADPDSGDRYATLGTETRRGKVITMDRLLTSPMTDSVRQLALTYGPVYALQPRSGQPALRLSVRQREEVVAQHQWSLDQLGQQPPSWVSLGVDARPWGARGEVLDWELFDDGPVAQYVFLSDVHNPGSAPEGPSFVLITTEGMGRPLFEAPDGQQLPTALRRYAAQGLLLPMALPSTSARTPGLVALMTGTSPRDSGFWQESHILSMEAGTLAEAFQRSGYRTFAAVYSPDLSHERSGLAQGFDVYRAPVQGLWSAAQTARHAIEWLSTLDGGRQFLWVHLPGPAPGSDAPPDWGSALEPLLEHQELQDLHLAFTSTLDQEGATSPVPPGARRVPLLLSGPGVKRSLPDLPRIDTTRLGRTFVEWAELPNPTFPGEGLLQGPIDGIDAAPAMLVDAGAERLCMQADGMLFVVPLRDEGGFGSRHLAQLYRLESDPQCAQDLAPGEWKQVRQMRTALARWTQSFEEWNWLEPRAQRGRAQAWIRPRAFGQAPHAPSNWLAPDCACPACHRTGNAKE